MKFVKVCITASLFIFLPQKDQIMTTLVKQNFAWRNLETKSTLCKRLKWYYDQKNHFLFSSDFESVFA